jgi:uncharacterized membrane protein YhhN
MSVRGRSLALVAGLALLAGGSALWWRFGDAIFVAGLGGWLC